MIIIIFITRKCIISYGLVPNYFYIVITLKMLYQLLEIRMKYGVELFNEFSH